MTKVGLAIEVMISNLDKPYANVSIKEANELEEEINILRDEFKKDQLKALQNNEDYSIQTALIYNDLIHSLEKAGDHIINVTEAIVANK